MWSKNADNKNGNAKAGLVPPALAVVADHSAASPLTPNNNDHGITAELARLMPVMDIQQAIQRRDVIVEAMKKLMKDGVDYGKIPGCGDKPALLQPGADKLCNLFGLTLQYDFHEKVEDWSGEQHAGEPFFYYQVAVRVYRGEYLMGEGVGSCSSRESKYRWRNAERTCPQCGKANIRKSREGGWYCWRKTEGCGTVFNDGDPAIEGQQTGRKANPDIYDAVNTILKISYKRAKISGVVNATSASEFFTQDVEDFTVTEEIDTGAHRPNTQAAVDYVAEQKIRTGNPNPVRVSWKSMQNMSDAFKSMREQIGETAWLEELERYGWRSFQDMRNAYDAAAGLRDPKTKDAMKGKIADCYQHMDARKGGR
jgi:ribosomal protein L37AE/L43A